jgi:virginiamycin A acetyltransferase
MLRSFLTCFKLFFINFKLKSFFNLFFGKIKFKGKNILIQESKFSGNITLYENVKVSNSFISGNVEIGRFSSINGPNTSVISSAKGNIIIGSFCSIARGVQIQEFNHRFNRASSYYFAQNMFNLSRDFDIDSKGDIIIEDDVWIGANCIILSGVKISRGAVIAAGSIVNKDVAPYSIVAGNPAKFIKKRFKEETIKELNQSKWWTWDMKKIRKNKDFFLKDII